MAEFQEIALEIIFIDRVGFIADVAKLFAECSLNITSMELKKSLPYYSLFIGADYSIDIDQSLLFTFILKIKDVVQVKSIDMLPHVERETRYRIVLDSISDGIISINALGDVTTMNKVASEISGVNNIKNTIGSKISGLNIDSDVLQKTIINKKVTRITENIETSKGRFKYLSSCQPIMDSKGNVVGAVEIMKSVKEIHDLANSVSKDASITFDNIIAKSQMMKEATDFARKVAVTDSFVTLRGESGTGKEVFANAIHQHSGRVGKFIAINCAALPESLLESELFGFVGGAFTGADRKGKIGLFESAEGGTIFLDEIADLPINMQAKMLRVLQDKKVRRIGDSKEVSINVRLICATNKNLESLVEAGSFREDLYYRINVFPIFIPPLRRRVEDIPELVQYFLDQLNNKLDKNVSFFTDDATKKLLKYDWKGNVRELKNIIERAFVLTGDDSIGEEHLLFGDNFSFKTGFEMYYQSTDKPLKLRVGDYEKGLIKEAMKQSLSIRKTAASLGISHVALLQKIKKYNIKVVK